MITFYGTLIAAALLSQAEADRTATGEVVDDQGKPVANAEVVLTTHFTGRIVDQDGWPVAGQLVEVWQRGDEAWLGPDTVELGGGPLRSADDGSFQTPDNLMAGSAYRVAIRGPGKEPVLSDWMTIGEKPQTLPSWCSGRRARYEAGWPTTSASRSRTSRSSNRAIVPSRVRRKPMPRGVSR
jgi:hypothetical protein